MARKRMIDPGIWTDDDLGSLGILCRLLFIGLLSNSDDEGYVNGSPAFLKAAIFPYDALTIEEVADARDQLVEAMRNIELLTDDNGKDILHFEKWATYQKINKPQPSQKKPTVKKKAIPLAARREIARRYGVDGSGQRAKAYCHYCGAEGSVHQTSNSWVHFRDLEIDHVIPESQGGTNDADNLVLACRSCNRQRGAQVVDKTNSQVVQNGGKNVGNETQVIPNEQQVIPTTEQVIPPNRIEENRIERNRTSCSADALPHTDESPPNGSKDVTGPPKGAPPATPKPRDQDTELYHQAQQAYLSQQPGERFTDYAVEGRQIKNLVKHAHTYAPEDPGGFLAEVVKTHWRLKQEPKSLFHGQPFLPSIAASKRMFPRILDAMHEREGDAELDEWNREELRKAGVAV